MDWVWQNETANAQPLLPLRNCMLGFPQKMLLLFGAWGFPDLKLDYSGREQSCDTRLAVCLWVYFCNLKAVLQNAFAIVLGQTDTVSWLNCSVSVRATGQGGDLMSDLFNKLVLRRKGTVLQGGCSFP